jgi:nucleoside-diphosphate-sugar epimerase
MTYRDVPQAFCRGAERVYVSDCVEGLYRLLQSHCWIPLNLRTDVAVTTDQIMAIVAQVAGKKVTIRHHRSVPRGVHERKIDNSLLRHVLAWKPQVSLAAGLARTYAWIAQQLAQPPVGIDDPTFDRAPANGRCRERSISAA